MVKHSWLAKLWKPQNFCDLNGFSGQHTIKLTHDWVYGITFGHDISVHVYVSVFVYVYDDITHICIDVCNRDF